MHTFPDLASMADPDIMQYDGSHKMRVNPIGRGGIDNPDEERGLIRGVSFAIAICSWPLSVYQSFTAPAAYLRRSSLDHVVSTALTL